MDPNEWENPEQTAGETPLDETETYENISFEDLIKDLEFLNDIEDTVITEAEPVAEKEDESKVPVRKRKEPRSPGKTVISYLHDLVYLLAVVIILLLLVFRIVVVSGPSMNDTLVDGDYILLLSNTFYREPKVGDIIVACKENFEQGEPIIKRVIATEGQTVDIDFEAGTVSVDGEILDEPYILTPTNLFEGVEFPVTVEKGCIFVMGDNRNRSKDSRSLEIGQIDRREVLGKALFLFFPGTDELHPQRDYTRMGVLD